MLVNKSLSWVCDMPQYIVGKSTDQLAEEYKFKKEDIVKLASNENPYGYSEIVKDFFRKGLTSIHRYPDPDCSDLKKKLSSLNGIGPDQIFVGNGSNEVLDYIAKGFISSGRSAVFSEYCFAVYPIIVQAAGGESLVASSDKLCGHSLENFLKKIKSTTSLIFIANPNNPTGGFLSNSEIELFLKEVDPNTVVVLDEAYHEYCLGQKNTVELLKTFKNLLITRSFSKAFGLAGLRVGYAIGSRSLIEYLNRLRQPFNVNLIAQKAACLALEDLSFVTKSVEKNEICKKFLEENFKKLKIFSLPSKGNFLLVKVNNFGSSENNKYISGNDVYKRLLRFGIITRPVENYGLTDWLRVSIGNMAESKRFLTAVTETYFK